MLFNNYDHKFTEGSGRLIFVPNTSARAFGKRLHRNVLRRWSPPDYFYHFNHGGHVAAAKAHLANRLFTRLDLARFFDSITRGRVHRSLRRIGFKQGYAWEAACESTVSKSNTEKSFSLPFGFVQSPILASLALSTSALGAALAELARQRDEAVSLCGMKLSIYMDDILLSEDDERELIVARGALEAAAAVSGFQFNPLKSSGPSPTLEVFNLSLSHGSLAVSSTRFADFEEAIKVADVVTIDGILGYVGTVNINQMASLAAL